MLSLYRHYQWKCLGNEKGGHNISPFVLAAWNHSCFLSSEAVEQVFD